MLDRKRTAAVLDAARERAALKTRLEGLARASNALRQRRAETMAARAAALRVHDPERTLERGYALLLGRGGEPLTRAASLREQVNFEVRLADGTVAAEVSQNGGAEVSENGATEVSQTGATEVPQNGGNR